jgi:IMP dehydrogenase
MNETALTYDDVILLPQFSDIESRIQIDLTTRITTGPDYIRVPYVATPMDTVCDFKMAKALRYMGTAGVIHRFMSIEEQVNTVVELKKISSFVIANGATFNVPIIAAIGANGDNIERAKELERAGATVLVIDVAHGHHINVYNTIKKLHETLHYARVVAGSIATAQAARDLCEWGVNAIRVGVGGGSLCRTRLDTGHGVPNITSIAMCNAVAQEYGVPVWTDGGIRNPGDVVKALGAGADCVMLGSVIAGTQETPGKVIEHRDGSLWKRYRGSASLETKVSHGLSERNVEGESTLVPFRGRVKYTIEKFNDGVRSGLSYSGARTIPEFQAKARFAIVTNAGAIEATPHGVK